MKRLLLGTVALVALANAATAADLYTKARPAPATVMPPPFSWTGFYVGPNLARDRKSLQGNSDLHRAKTLCDFRVVSLLSAKAKLGRVDR
jgi:hypothetical protein